MEEIDFSESDLVQEMARYNITQIQVIGFQTDSKLTHTHTHTEYA